MCVYLLCVCVYMCVCRVYVCVLCVRVCVMCMYVCMHVCICHVFFIQSSAAGHLGGFHVLTIIHNAALHTGVQISLWSSDLVSFSYRPSSGTAGSHGSLFLTFWGASILFSMVGPPVGVPTSSARGSLFSTSSPALVVSCFWERPFCPMWGGIAR